MAIAYKLQNNVNKNQIIIQILNHCWLTSERVAIIVFLTLNQAIQLFSLSQ